MSERIKIGDYIIDAAETGSTSTTTGVRLFPDGKASIDAVPEPLKWVVAETTVLSFWVRITGANMAALKTAEEALHDEVTSPFGDVLIESVADTTRAEFKISDGTYTGVSGVMEIEDTEGLVSFARVVLTFTRVLNFASGGLPAGSTDPIPGLASPGVSVSTERNIAGRLAFVIEAPFKSQGNLLSLTITSVEDDGNSKARFVFSGSPDFSGVSPGATLTVSGSGAYNGAHTISDVDDPGDKLTTATAFGATDTGSGIVSGITADGSAKNFIAMVKARSAPASQWGWLPIASELRVVAEMIAFAPDTEDTSGNKTAAGETVARILMREMANDLTSLDSKIRDVQSAIQIIPSPIDQRASAASPTVVVITGKLEVETEGNATFDPNVSTPAQLTNVELNAAIDIIRDAELVRAEVSAITEVERDITRAAESGGIGFTIKGFADTTILAWEELIAADSTSNAVFIGDVAGDEFIYEGTPPDVTFIEHSLTIKSLSTPQYKAPSGITSKHKVVKARETQPKITVVSVDGSNIVVEQTVSYLTIYRRASDQGSKDSLGDGMRAERNAANRVKGS